MRADFYTIFRVTVLLTAITWRSVVIGTLVLPYGVSTGSLLLSSAWGLLPYVALAGSARWIANRFTLILAALVLFYSDIQAGTVAMDPSSSTNPVALMIQPMFGLFIVVPAALLLGFMIRKLTSSGERRMR
jgi:hypothetical protein